MSRIDIHSYGQKQIKFFNIDQHAYKASLQDARKFSTLISYLKTQIPANDKNHTLYLARGIIAWLSYALQKFSVEQVGEKKGEPVTLVQAMGNQKMFYSEVFKRFCDEASIECVVITGRCKAIKYKAGDADSDYLRTSKSWNAFKANHKWHLVNPTWVLNAITNYIRGGEIELVGDANNALRAFPHFEGIHTHVLNDFWFCTNPEIFITRCLPYDTKWQLLPQDRSIRSVDEFLALPDLRQGFFHTRLELLTEKSCRLRASHGRCLIGFSTDRERARRLQFSYKLTLVQGLVPDINIDDLPQCIFHSRPSETIFNFEIRFLFPGTFRFHVKAGFIHEKVKPTCGEFLIVCDQVDPNCGKLPINAGEVGWGPGPSTLDAGIRGSSEKTGKVLLEQSTHDPSKKSKTITLRPTEEALSDTVFESVVFGSDEVDDGEVTVEFPGNVRVDEEKCKLELDVEVKVNKEAALVVTARNRGSREGTGIAILNYLLLDKEHEYDREERIGLKQKERKARKEYKYKLKSGRRESLLRELTMYQTEVHGYVGGKKPTDKIIENKVPGKTNTSSKVNIQNKPSSSCLLS